MTDLNDLLKPSSKEEAEEYAVENLMLSIQIAIQKAMELKGVCQKDLAEKMGVSEARISQMLSSNGSNLTLKSIGRISNALDQVFELVTQEEVRKMRSKPSLVKEVACSTARRVPRKIGWRDQTANVNRFPFEEAA